MRTWSPIFEIGCKTTLTSAYRVERELGAGMSRVFLAEERALCRRVVVKVLSPDLAAGVNFERFKHDILLTAQLQHPHILPVFTTGETQGLPYYTMPFVEGESLRVHLMRAGAMPIAGAVAVSETSRARWSSRTPKVSCTGTSSRTTSCSPAIPPPFRILEPPRPCWLLML